MIAAAPVRLHLVAVLALIGAVSAGAQEQASIGARRATEHPLSNVGLPIGAHIPAFSAKDQDGNVQTFESIRGPKGAVIYFYRSASWCIYCRAQLVETERARESLRRNGLGLVGVSYDSPQILKDFAVEKGIGFPLLSDPDSKVIRDFAVLDNTVLPGNTAYGVPYHGNYIVDHDGVVIAKLFDAESTLAHSTGVVVQRLFGSPVNTHQKTIEHNRLAITYFASSNTVAAGDEIELTIDVALNEGIHVYAPPGGPQIPVEWELAPSSVFSAGATVFPPAQQMTEPTTGDKMQVYNGKFRLTRVIKFDAGSLDAPGAVDVQGNVAIPGVFRFQACDEEKCYTPTKIALNWRLGKELPVPVEEVAHHHH